MKILNMSLICLLLLGYNAANAVKGTAPAEMSCDQCKVDRLQDISDCENYGWSNDCVGMICPQCNPSDSPLLGKSCTSNKDCYPSRCFKGQCQGK